MAEAAPPAYEDVVVAGSYALDAGGHTGSSTYTGAATSVLFQDFWPQCENKAEKAKYGAFQSFRFVMFRRPQALVQCSQKYMYGASLNQVLVKVKSVEAHVHYDYNVHHGTRCVFSSA